MKLIINNIFANIPADLKAEVFEPLIEESNFKLERIISEAHSSPPGYWYDQEKNEFVLLLQGSAELSFENEDSIILRQGDYLIIPAHKKHRVKWTDETTQTIWLALHY